VWWCCRSNTSVKEKGGKTSGPRNYMIWAESLNSLAMQPAIHLLYPPQFARKTQYIAFPDIGHLYNSYRPHPLGHNDIVD
jgi:hypothetical protein